MRRPQSAKPGHRGMQMQMSSDDLKEEETHSRNMNRKQVKIMKPQLTTNDFARIMPKKIYQDKQRLYSETLQLKQTLNEIYEENTRLRTRISILQKEKDKMNRYLESATENVNKTQSRMKLYSGQNKNADKQNMIVRNLKKMIRESKDENQYLKQQNAKIKKAIKYTRINELEIERKMLQDQNQKLNQVLDQLHERINDQQQYERQVNELKAYLDDQVDANKQLSESNQKYIEYIEELEEKLKKQTDRAIEKERKLQRDLALQKRKLNEALKVSDDLRKQIKYLKENSTDFKKKPMQKAQNRPVSSNPYTQKPQITNSLQNKRQYDQIKQKNVVLERKLQQTQLKLEKSEARLKQKFDQKSQKRKETENSKKQLKLDSQPNYEESNDDHNQPFILEQGNKIEQKNEDEYADEFEEEQSKKVNNEIDEYKKDFEEESQEAEALYQKEEVKNKKGHEKSREKESKSKSKKDKEKGKGFKPNKKLMSEIKELLTYRMKAQRYPFEELKKDIDASNEASFSCADLEGMMKAEPFYLIPRYTTAFLQYAFEKEAIHDKSLSISSQTFLKKVRKVIDDFVLPEEDEEEEMLLRIAEMTTTYPSELEIAFEKIKNGPETVARDKLIDMFKKLELADNYIELIISELTLCSDDLQHLNFHGFFQRFYIENGSSRNQAIDQEQIESSGEERKKTPASGKKGNNYDEYEDDKVNFIMQDEGELSMGMRGNENYDNDVLSDDGHI